jgi:hypothetical protein
MTDNGLATLAEALRKDREKYEAEIARLQEAERGDATSIAAIRAAERARLRAAVEALDFMVPRGCDCHPGELRRAQEPDEYRAAVLALLEPTDV